MAGIICPQAVLTLPHPQVLEYLRARTANRDRLIHRREDLLGGPVKVMV